MTPFKFPQAITVPRTTPRLYTPSTLLPTQVIVFAIQGYIPIAPRNVPAYATWGFRVATSIENPAHPMHAKEIFQTPRRPVLSAAKPTNTVWISTTTREDIPSSKRLHTAEL